MATVRFYDKSHTPEGRLIYSVIPARYRGKWIFVRNRISSAWGICAGHIEDGETSDEAAARELMEETGALEFSLHRIATYSVEKEGKTGYGRLYYAEVIQLGPVPEGSEIAERIFGDGLPDDLIYPDVQPVLFSRVLKWLREERLV
ncbi:MAG: NUDIX domain-containing protein [Bacteroidales bacterium]|nr:NUDIX domain-containing protein [Bacteroidales bacterium]